MENIKGMTRAEARDFIRRQNWTFSKTCAEFAPHEYVVFSRIRLEDREDMRRFAHIIHVHGIPMWYNGKHRHMYLWIDGWYYWTCGDQDDTDFDLINRCREEEYKMVFDFKKAKERKQGKQLSLEDFTE